MLYKYNIMELSFLKTILVTGSTGFIGTNLCQSLLKGGHKVIGLCKESPKNISDLNYHIIQHDVCEPFSYLKCDEVYHLAAYSSNSMFIKDPCKAIETILLGTINALIFTRSTGAKFLFASTLGIYNETKNELDFQTSYDLAKKTMESYVCNFGNQYSVDTKTVRIPSTFGPHMKIGIIPNIINSTLNKEEIKFEGDIKKEIPFCYVGDLIKVLKYVMEKGQAKPRNIPLNYIKYWNYEKLYKIIPEIIKSDSSDFGEGFKETIDYFKTKKGK